MIAGRVLAVPSTSMPSESIFFAAVLLINELRNRLSIDIVDSIIFFKTKTVFLRILRKMQRKAILPVLLACSLNLNISTCMQYAANFWL